MQLSANLILYIALSLGGGYLLRFLLKPEDGSPKLTWYTSGLVIGGGCALVNALLVSVGGLNGSFKLELHWGLFLGGLGAGLLIGLPISLVTAYDMSKRFTMIDAWVLLFKDVIIFVVIGGTIASLAAPKYGMEEWIGFISSGLSQGSIYALVALGYTLVYGILLMINFAHGEIFMSGAFTAYFVADALAKAPNKDTPSFLDAYPLMGLLIIFSVAIATSTATAITVEQIAYRPLRRAPRLILLITAIGASFFLQYTFQSFYGSGVKGFPKILILQGPLLVSDLLLLGGFLVMAGLMAWASRPLYRRLKIRLSHYDWVPAVVIVLLVLLLAYFVVPPLHNFLLNQFGNVESKLPISRVRFLVIISSVVMMIGLYNFVQHTKMGKAMRAVAEDKDVAALMGINVDRVITVTFAVGAALAGAGGVLFAMVFGQVHFFMGFLPGLKAFTAAVLGGIGNLPGAMLGGILLGIFESLGPSLFLEGLGIEAANQLKDVIAFTMLVLVLIFRPTGIMGVELSKKKA